jgi:peroxiredoxin
MTRAVPTDQVIERPPTLIHSKSEETFPVSLTDITKDSIAFNWEVATTHALPTSQLHALQFAGPRLENSGFDGPRWQAIGTTTPSLKDKVVTLAPGSGIGHPYALQGEDIGFTMEGTGGASTIRIRLFATSLDQKAGTVNFLIGDFGSEIYCGIERGEDGQFNTRSQLPRGSDGNEIRLTFPGDAVEMWVNGMKAAEYKREAKDKSTRGPGIVIETASMWGNQMREVKVRDFEGKGNAFNAAPPLFSEDAKREALLLPRVHRDAPPKQILIGRNGDLLRGEIETMTSTHMLFRAGMETFKVPLDRVSSAVWLKKPDKPTGKETDEEKAKAKAKPVDPANPLVKPDPNAERKPDAPTFDPEHPVQWLDLVNGGRVQIPVETWTADGASGKHELLGECKIPIALISRVTIKQPPPTAGYGALANWKLVNTQDPVLPEDENTASPLMGKDAAPFSLALLLSSKVNQDLGPAVDDGLISLKDMKGKVVVLDFWATWCGPCLKSLPGLVEAMKAFPEDKVAFLAVNQGETKEQVRKFLEARNLTMPVGFDATQEVARKYGVEGIPHTVVISREGKIALVKTGYTPDGEKEISAAVEKALQ